MTILARSSVGQSDGNRRRHPSHSKRFRARIAIRGRGIVGDVSLNEHRQRDSPVATRCAESVILDERIETPVCVAPIVHSRSIEVTDAALIREFVQSLSFETRYLRFMSALKERRAHAIAARCGRMTCGACGERLLALRDCGGSRRGGLRSTTTSRVSRHRLARMTRSRRRPLWAGNGSATFQIVSRAVTCETNTCVHRAVAARCGRNIRCAQRNGDVTLHGESRLAFTRSWSPQ